ncbi:putative dehydrogenase [Halovivax ruber XH-70]|uniref:Putative dehydrogenase n=1 Tax=Halovivax ruber (strain DSM 18193 / JCM 13892 / XH-70) TaxID=797302 RepID=L0IDQ4_HALRX|nr:Gfo/Idh/MocA family oxidoreductase [Halovivax ruber]AGB16102.1 putative dehydrogenase [Halovivax ruber XH-70]
MALDVGVLGYRFMGTAHANAFARLPMFFPDTPDVTRDVLIGRDEDALGDARTRLGFDRTATDWRSVVDEVDVFYNLGPNFLHAEPAIAALEAGVSVFSEKPLAATLDGATEMAAAARSAGVPTACGFNYRFVPAIRYARELIQSGTLGDIRTFRGRYLQDWLVDPEAPWSWRLDAELAGSGALGDLGAHTVDLARFLVGDAPGGGRIERVSGHLRTAVTERPVEGPAGETRPVTVDDEYTAQLAFEDGAIGLLEGSRIAPGHKNDHTIEIHGSEGSLRFSLERLNELEMLGPDDRGYETVLVTDETDPYIDHWWPPGHVLGWEHTFVHENASFLRAVAEGDAYEPSFADGLAAQHVLAAIEASDQSGSWERVTETSESSQA